MSALQPGDLFIVIGACACGQGLKAIGKIKEVAYLAPEHITCSGCGRTYNGPTVVQTGEKQHKGWPLSAVRKIEPLPSTETIDRKEELLA